MPLYKVVNPTKGTPEEPTESNRDLLNKNFRSRIGSRDSKTGARQERTDMNPDLQFLDVKDATMAMLATGGDVSSDQTFRTYANDLKNKLGDENAMKVIQSITLHNKEFGNMSPKERISSWLRNSSNQNEYVGKLTRVLKNAYSDYDYNSTNNESVNSMLGRPSRPSSLASNL